MNQSKIAVLLLLIQNRKKERKSLREKDRVMTVQIPNTIFRNMINCPTIILMYAIEKLIE